ncbi:hypothetical protein [Terricaulis silvestris]|uniref:Uncharacterized protein n=1 Tax=Terricaulis silvestris TaxID=2686094 RepID=A0A6I6MXG3_9CAUL|nr:hypothetical protein [Terricaulis silvestris]QGZ95883.1 hypothetical protein DSM104635_02738 [Terricaulis silvestris]
MIRAISAILIAALATWCEPASAQAQLTPEQRAAYDALQERFRIFREVRNEAIHSPYGKWSVVFSRSDTWGNAWIVVSFGVDISPPNPTYLWQAQIRTSSSSDMRELSAGDCPALLDQLAALESLPLPTIDLPRVGNELPPTVVPSPQFDGDDNRLWTRSAGWNRRLLFTNDIEISGNIGSPVALWADEMLAALEPCWRPTRAN